MCDKVIKCDDEEPNVNNIVYIINAYEGRGFTPCYYKKKNEDGFR